METVSHSLYTAEISLVRIYCGCGYLGLKFRYDSGLQHGCRLDWEVTQTYSSAEHAAAG